MTYKYIFDFGEQMCRTHECTREKKTFSKIGSFCKIKDKLQFSYYE